MGANLGRPEVHAFLALVMACAIGKACLSPRRPSPEAREYVFRIEKKIVVVDGQQLTSLVTALGVGVTP